MKVENYASLSKAGYLFHILRHPVDGYHELKNNNKFSLTIANILLGLWVLLSILNWGYIDYDFRNNFADVELIFVLGTTVFLFAISVVSNWSFCTLLDGKGRAKEIWVVCAYALLPYLICGYIRVILSFFMVVDEAVFLTYLETIAILWSCFLVVIGLSALHEYDIKKTLLSILLTIVGDLIIIFLMVLVSGLVTQIYNFFMTVFSEVYYRIS